MFTELKETDIESYLLPGQAPASILGSFKYSTDKDRVHPERCYVDP